MYVFYNIVCYLQAVGKLLSTDASVHWHFSVLEEVLLVFFVA